MLDTTGADVTVKGSYIRIAGNGTATNARSNAEALDWNGNLYLKGDVYVGCGADSTGGTKLGTGGGATLLWTGTYTLAGVAAPITFEVGKTYMLNLQYGGQIIFTFKNETNFVGGIAITNTSNIRFVTCQVSASSVITAPNITLLNLSTDQISNSTSDVVVTAIYSL